MFNRVVVKLISKIKEWIVPAESQNFRISETINQHVSIESLPDIPEISLSFIHFDSEIMHSNGGRIFGKKFTKCLLSHETIQGYTFTNCKFVDCQFNGALLLSVEFHDCEFDECLFYKTKFSNTYIDPDSFHFTKKWHWIRSNINAGLFQSLYNNAKTMHQDAFAMRADRRFQFYRRYQHLHGDRPRTYKFLRGLLFDYLLGHGYGIMNSLAMTVFSILVFAWALDGKVKSEHGTFIETLYFTVVSLTTVGYGDITPLHEVIPLAITMLLLLLSVAWCAVVTAIIVKRIVK